MSEETTNPPPGPLARNRQGWTAVSLVSRWPVLLLVTGLCALIASFSTAFDRIWASGFTMDRIPGDVRKALHLSEVFGHGAGAAAILGSIWAISPGHRRSVWLAVLITALSGLLAHGVKGCFVRVRPYAEMQIEVEGQPPAIQIMPGESPREVVVASFWDSRQRSFPSGHAATAWGLMIGLSLMFPRGIPLFALFASLACLQRIVSGAHFPSDVLAGAAIASLTAAAILSIPALYRTTTPLPEET